ncbi:hypothetical protein BP00DRAFT_273588 [Aspergillus indologenus CBS 114.80]|uniref:Uncharacterized protein n=1 Tax=Aspergillus indologenus CBS 114.80 TaxID=1450541 RepID=A0A2V5HZG8_9EURO|nr:hypothetical protein BP00DRAFT_273588 [Aspergillus indologenus CBS 114.80]
MRVAAGSQCAQEWRRLPAFFHCTLLFPLLTLLFFFFPHSHSPSELSSPSSLPHSLPPSSSSIILLFPPIFSLFLPFQSGLQPSTSSSSSSNLTFFPTPLTSICTNYQASRNLLVVWYLHLN